MVLAVLAACSVGKLSSVVRPSDKLNVQQNGD
jgi:hypothetical protein